MGLAEVSDILWRERELLDILLFKLEEQQLLLDAGRVRWLGRATHEVEIVLEQIRLTNLTRSIEVDSVAASLGLAPNPSLSAIADASPVTWAYLVHAHRTAFVTLTHEIIALAEANRDVVSSAYRAARKSTLAVGADEAGHTPTGRRARAPNNSADVTDDLATVTIALDPMQQASYQAALSSMSNVLQLSRTQFLT